MKSWSTWALFAVLLLIVGTVFFSVKKGEPAPIGDQHYVSEYGDWRKIRGEGIMVRAHAPVKVEGEDEVAALIEIKNVRGSVARLSRFDVARYMTLDKDGFGVEGYKPICDERYDCGGFGNLESGEEIQRTVGFKSNSDEGRFEMGFYGRDWTRVVEYRKGSD